jgi:[ribosomal protein S5]-alanine N-acetyltransferase
VETAPNYFLRTARLGFRPWSAGDFELAMALWGDIQVTRFIGGPFSEKEVQERLAREFVFMKEHGVQYWPVFLLGDGDFTGCCGLRPYRLEDGIYELGFHFRPMHWGKGFAGEASRAVIGHAFKSLRARGLFAGHYPENHASSKVLEKLGFRFTHEESYPPTGRMHRCYMLELPA